jgi:hypothetical protein
MSSSSRLSPYSIASRVRSGLESDGRIEDRRHFSRPMRSVASGRRGLPCAAAVFYNTVMGVQTISLVLRRAVLASGGRGMGILTELLLPGALVADHPGAPDVRRARLARPRGRRDARWRERTRLCDGRVGTVVQDRRCAARRDRHRAPVASDGPPPVRPARAGDRRPVGDAPALDPLHLAVDRVLWRAARGGKPRSLDRSVRTERRADDSLRPVARLHAARERVARSTTARATIDDSRATTDGST